LGDIFQGAIKWIYWLMNDKMKRDDGVCTTKQNQAQMERLAELIDKKLVSLEWHMHRFFGHCLPMLRDARVLDVGCGKGTTTFYSALCGAKEVVGLDPETGGSTHGSNKRFLEIREELGLGQCVQEPVDFLSYKNEVPFDMVLLYNTINHIRDVTSDVRYAPEARKSQSRVVAKIAEMLKVGGWVVFCDSSRRNLFGDLGLRSPISPSINRKGHQCPGAWRELFVEQGLGQFSCNRYVPYIVPWACWLLDNPVCDYLTFSHFVMRGRKIR